MSYFKIRELKLWIFKKKKKLKLHLSQQLIES